MRSLVVSTFLTLAASCRPPGGPEEDPTGGFAHGGWSVNYWDEAMGAAPVVRRRAHTEGSGH